MKAFSSRPRGAAAVEFALVLPLLLTILFGTIEWGYYFYTREVVINSAREGARAGTLQGATTTTAAKATKDYLTSAGLVASNATVSTNVTATGGACEVANSSCIHVKYALPSLTGFLDAFLGSTRTIVAYAEMRK